MTTIHLAKRYGTDISSRRTASMLRRELVTRIQKGQVRATIDFDGVESVSDSFLDELFGVIVRDLGKQWFRDYIKLINVQPDDRSSILQVVALRLEESRPHVANPTSVRAIA